MRACRVRKCKRPTGNGLWGAYEIRRDEHGVWLYTPEGSRYRGTSRDGAVGECFVGQPEPPGLHVLQLVPSGDAWWYGHWTVDRRQCTLSVDVCTPAVLDGDEWAYVDLELDLYKSSDGTVGIEDEDEFDEAVGLGLISDKERRACLAITAELGRRLRVHDPVLDDLAWSVLAEVTRLGLPPITDFSHTSAAPATSRN